MYTLPDYITGLQDRCYQAADGKLDDKQKSALKEETKGGFSAIPVVGPNIKRLADAENWNGLAGALGACLAMDSSSNGVNVTQNANPTISQSQTISIALSIQDVVRAIDTDDISDEDRTKIKALLLDAQAEKDDSKLKKIGKAIAGWGFDKATESLPALLGFLYTLFMK